MLTLNASASQIDQVVRAIPIGKERDKRSSEGKSLQNEPDKRYPENKTRKRLIKIMS
jgi:hypothetical protein